MLAVSRVARRLLGTSVMLLVLATTGCGNPCQQLCNKMARAWVDCGMDVPDGAIQECRTSLAEPSDDERSVCADALGTGEESLSARWDDCCEIRYPLPGMAIPEGDDCAE